MAIVNQPEDVEVLCKKCNNKSKASEFKVDPLLGLMVCPKCYGMKPVLKKEEEKKDSKPLGWDKDDDILDTLYKEKQRNKLSLNDREIRFERVDGTPYLIYKCEGCGYEIKYNSAKHYPKCCPACSRNIPKELYRIVFDL